MLLLEDISIAYGKNRVVDKLGFSLSEGQIGCLLGPSGCGKTSILRAIAGFEPVQQGHISLRGNKVSSQGGHLVPEKRHIAVVFQDFALFPHLSIGENVSFGLHQLPLQVRKEKTTKMLDLVGLPGLENRYPHELSGGQQQRIALARAMATEPDLLLLDEPFSSLDAELREDLARDIRRIVKQQNITALMVTHDQHEAFAMADVIGVMKTGNLHQWASAYELYHQPASKFVADFIGSGVFIPGRITDQGLVKTCLGSFPQSPQSMFNQSQEVQLLVRPDDIEHDDASSSMATVKSRVFRGSHILYELEIHADCDVTVLCLAPSHHDHQVGESIGIKLDLEHLVMFPREA